MTTPDPAGSGGENFDRGELAKFSALAHHWWDPDSTMFGALHLSRELPIQNASPEQIQAMQFERLKRFLTEAGLRVPYCRSLFAKLGFDPSSLRSVRHRG